MKLEDGMSTKTRRQYTEEFKAEAVRLVRDSAKPVAQVARELGIADHLLYRWRAEQQGWVDAFGFPDQIRAADEFGWNCFHRWQLHQSAAQARAGA